MGFDKIWIRINQFHLAMATPFRRPYVSWRVVSSIGDLRGCTISGTRQHAGQAIAPIPRSSGDGPVEIQRPPISVFSRSISLYKLVLFEILVEVSLLSPWRSPCRRGTRVIISTPLIPVHVTFAHRVTTCTGSTDKERRLSRSTRNP